MRTWKTIEVGANEEELKQLITLAKEKDIFIDRGWGEEESRKREEKNTKILLSSISPKKEIVTLVKVDIRNLFGRNYDYDEAVIEYSDILAKARKKGLLPCPPEVGIRLLLQKPKSKDSEYWNIGMESVNNSILYVHPRCIYSWSGYEDVELLGVTSGDFDESEDEDALCFSYWIFIKDKK
jgi:hypothetical protein